MDRPKAVKALLAGGLLVVIVVAIGLAASNDVTLDGLKRQRNVLLEFSREHYTMTVLLFMCAFASTAFAVPGAIVLSLAGGLLFGTIWGAVYADAAATAGALGAFLLSRYLGGRWFQSRYEHEGRLLKREIQRHGRYYLLFLRIVPIMPFFLVNYLAGLTGMRAATFTWTTALGMLPGALIYANAGGHLARIQSPDEILSWPVVTALGLLAAASLTPVLWRAVRRRSA